MNKTQKLFIIDGGMYIDSRGGPNLLKKFLPNEHVERVLDITPQKLKKWG